MSQTSLTFCLKLCKKWKLLAQIRFIDSYIDLRGSELHVEKLVLGQGYTVKVKFTL